jgi:T-complex protein 1 subunit gamma
LEGHYNYGVDGDTGKMTDMKEYGLLESASVKIQTLKTAIEVCPAPLSHDEVNLTHSPQHSY